MPRRVNTSTVASWIVKVRAFSVTGMPTTVKARGAPFGRSRKPSPSRSRYPALSKSCKLCVRRAVDRPPTIVILTWYVGTAGLYHGRSSWTTGLREMIVDGYSWRYRSGFSVTARADRRLASDVTRPERMLNPNESCGRPGFWTIVASFRSVLLTPPMLMIWDGSSTRRLQPMKSRFPLRSAVAAVVVLLYTLNVTVSRCGGRKCAAFAVSVHEVAVEDVTFHGPLPTGFATLPAFTIGRMRPCPNRRPPPDAEDSVTVFPTLDAARSAGTRATVLYWLYEYTTSAPPTAVPSVNFRSDRNVAVSVVPEIDHEAAAQSVGVSVAGSIRARLS